MPVQGPSAAALHDFQRARRRADLQQVLSLFRGQEERLLSFDEVRRQLQAVETARRELKDIPLSAIVGSVGRYQDFTRSFMPVSDTNAARWVGVQRAMTGLEGVPPVEVYKLGDAYFVKDGHHRVSVATQMGSKMINAYVTEVATRVPFTPDMDQNDLILASEFADFLARTNLDELRPGADLRVTVPGRYPELLEHIEVHRYFMGIDLGRPVEWQEAALHWYDAVYLPVARAIRRTDLLQGFPGRTEADLYLFLSEHRGRLQRQFGWTLGGSMLAEGLAPARRFADLQERAAQLRDAAATDVLLNGVLLCLTGGQGDDQVLRHGLELARRQHAVAFGLLLAGQDQAAAATVGQRFDAACRQAEVEGQLAGSPAQTAREIVREVQARAKYVDVVVVPNRGPLTEALLRRCPKPLVVASDRPAGVSRPLLAYDGGAKANEALFALAYLSVSRGLKPVVLHVERRGRGLDLAPLGAHQEADGERRAGRGETTVPRGKAEDSSLARAGDYLEGLGIKAELVTAYGPVAAAIAQTAEDHGCDVIFVGSHSRLRWLEEALGGVLDELLLRTQLPLVVT